MERAGIEPVAPSLQTYSDQTVATVGDDRQHGSVAKLGAGDVVDFGGWVVSVWHRLF